MKILIVEDEYNAREGLAALIRKTCPEHTICGKAENGREGYEMAVEYKPDLAFVDIELPEMNGLEMIKKLQQTEQLQFQMPAFVILSGYAEFKYAQQAIKYGVLDYLLKPISYEKLQNVIKNLGQRNGLQKKNGRTGSISRENILSSILLNDDVFSREALETVKSELYAGNKYLINIYYGNNRTTENLLKVVLNFFHLYDFTGCYYSFIKEYEFLATFVNTNKTMDEIEKNLNYNLMYSVSEIGFKDYTVVFSKIDDPADLLGMIGKIKILNSWALSLGNEKAISPELIDRTPIENTIPSRRFDMEALYALKNNENTHLKKINSDFIDSLKTGNCSPEQIIKKCISYTFSILVCFKELNPEAYDTVQDFQLFDAIKNCCTLQEIKNCLNELTDLYFRGKSADDAGYPVQIRKILNTIRTSYDTVISLEQLADCLDVTPEYLSHLFTKTVGTSFSNYLKKYRIDIAKKMMLDSNCKICEIGKKTGYRDSKYFSKIFKEVTGLSPREYHSKLHP